MSLAAGLLFASASLHAAAAVFYASLHRATQRPEHRAFARFAGSFGGLIVGSGLMLAGVSEPVWVLCGIASWVCGGLAVAAIAEFCAVLAAPGETPRRYYGIQLALVVVTLALSYAWIGDLHVALEGRAPLPAGLPALVRVGITFVILLHAVRRLARATPARPELRAIVSSITLSVIVAFVGELVRWRTGSSYFLVEHSGLLIIAGSTVTLANRQVGFAAELAERNQALSEAHEKLASARKLRGTREPLAALGELSAVVAHEVRNPLAIVKNAVSSLRRPALDPEDRATLLEIVGEEAGRLSRLVRDLLVFARPRAAVEVQIDVRQMLHRAVRDATRGVTSAISRIETDVAETGPLVGDTELLRLALANVIENALQAADDDSKVVVTIVPMADGLAIEVQDHGRGMAPDVLEKARDPFFTTRPTGTGLGLAIVDRVLRAHGGTLEIESEVGRGSTVRLRLPSGQARSTPSVGMVPA